MAEGVRIRPKPGMPWRSDDIVVVTDWTRPFKKLIPTLAGLQPIEKVKAPCGTCGQVHLHKTYHITLRDGTAIVSPTVWDMLQRIDANPFEYANPVADPPRQHIALDPRHPKRGDDRRLQFVDGR